MVCRMAFTAVGEVPLMQGIGRALVAVACGAVDGYLFFESEVIENGRLPVHGVMATGTTVACNPVQVVAGFPLQVTGGAVVLQLRRQAVMTESTDREARFRSVVIRMALET